MVLVLLLCVQVENVFARHEPRHIGRLPPFTHAVMKTTGEELVGCHGDLQQNKIIHHVWLFIWTWRDHFYPGKP